MDELFKAILLGIAAMFLLLFFPIIMYFLGAEGLTFG
jgi:hypothetical protein